MHSSTPYSSSLFSIQLAVWLAGSLISGPQEGLKIRGGGGGGGGGGAGAGGEAGAGAGVGVEEKAE